MDAKTDEIPASRAAGAPAAAAPGKRSKKGKKKGAQHQSDENLYINVVPLPSDADLLEKVMEYEVLSSRHMAAWHCVMVCSCLLEQEWRPVQLSKAEKAAQAVLSNDNLTVTMHKGYRMVCPERPGPCTHRATGTACL
jgi:hypothetical protein